MNSLTFWGGMKLEATLRSIRIVRAPKKKFGIENVIVVTIYFGCWWFWDRTKPPFSNDREFLIGVAIREYCSEIIWWYLSSSVFDFLYNKPDKFNFIRIDSIAFSRICWTASEYFSSVHLLHAGWYVEWCSCLGSLWKLAATTCFVWIALREKDCEEFLWLWRTTT